MAPGSRPPAARENRGADGSTMAQNNYGEPKSLAAAKEDLESARRKVTRLENEKKRDEEAGAQFLSRIVTAGTGIGVALASGALFEAVPRLKSFDKGGRIGTRPFVAGATMLGALAFEGGIGDAFEGSTYGIGLPFVSEQGAKIVRAIKGG